MRSRVRWYSLVAVAAILLVLASACGSSDPTPTPAADPTRTPRPTLASPTATSVPATVAPTSAPTGAPTSIGSPPRPGAGAPVPGTGAEITGIVLSIVDLGPNPLRREWQLAVLVGSTKPLEGLSDPVEGKQGQVILAITEENAGDIPLGSSIEAQIGELGLVGRGAYFAARLQVLPEKITIPVPSGQARIRGEVFSPPVNEPATGLLKLAVRLVQSEGAEAVLPNVPGAIVSFLASPGSAPDVQVGKEFEAIVTIQSFNGLLAYIVSGPLTGEDRG